MTAIRQSAIVASRSARPLRHWPDAALERANGTLERVWRDWCARWQLTGAEVATSNACDGAAVADASAQSWATGRSLWLSTGSDDMRVALAKVLFNEDARTGAPIAQALVTDALSELLRAFGQVSAGNDRAADAAGDAPPAAERRRWSGALRVCLVALREDQPVSWHLHCSEPLASVLCGGLQPPSATGRAPLAAVTHAIDARPVAFKVLLDETTLTLGTLQSLRVGDVLPLSHRLDQALHVVSAGASRDTPAFCGAFLGSRDHHRAVELVPADSASPSIES